MLDRPILIIHPNDKTTSFLNKIKSHLIRGFEKHIHHFNIQCNDESHNQCLDRIVRHRSEGLIIFLGHGRTDKLYGGKGDSYGTLASPDAIAENPEKYYYNDDFINQSNIDVFANKKVFCLACNSNNKLANYAIENGTKTFFGFGDIPTSNQEFIDDGLNVVSNDIVQAMKTELNAIMKSCLFYSIEKSKTFEQLKEIIEFSLSKRIAEYLIERKNFDDRYILTEYLFRLKKEMMVFGDKNAKLIG
jgi:hypothetical protein